MEINQLTSVFNPNIIVLLGNCFLSQNGSVVRVWMKALFYCVTHWLIKLFSPKQVFLVRYEFNEPSTKSIMHGFNFKKKALCYFCVSAVSVCPGPNFSKLNYPQGTNKKCTKKSCKKRKVQCFVQHKAHKMSTCRFKKVFNHSWKLIPLKSLTQITFQTHAQWCYSLVDIMRDLSWGKTST